MDGERATYEDLITLRFNGGAIRSFEMRKFPVTDADGNITSVGTISTDITGRVVAEQALRESEAKFHAIFAEAGLGMALIDKDGVFFDVNPALARMFGMSCDELVGKDIRTLTAPEDIDRSIESFDDLVSGETDVRKLEKQYLHKNGEPFTASVISSVVHDRDGKFEFSVGLVEDITERKSAERALRESEELLRAISDNSPAAIYLKDIDGKFIFANQIWHDIYNPAGTDIVGKTVGDFIPSKPPNRRRRRMQRCWRRVSPSLRNSISRMLKANGKTCCRRNSRFATRTATSSPLVASTPTLPIVSLRKRPCATARKGFDH